MIRWRRKTLTPEEVKHMVLDYNLGMAIKDITVKYGVSKATVYNKLREVEEAQENHE